MFSKILIANRGEIACRIIKTLRNLQITAVAVYSAADKNAKHVRMADEAYYLGPAAVTESYLDIKKILAIAKLSQATAIHPGYGLLSENPDFAKACAENNVIFIGPQAEIIASMGLKSTAKKIMQQHGVPVIPDVTGIKEPQELLQAAKTLKFPVLIKADAGGGGKGMRVVTQEQDFLDALASCQREAQASFGCPDVILEKFLDNPKHIEIQIFGDTYGNVVHLYDRDCSIQRRYQKIIEQAPASSIPIKVRKKMAEVSVQAMKKIGYYNAGTLEFLVDKDFNFYFLEMNTRLQVEHPITEMLTNIDIIQWQILIANQQKIPLAQSDIIAKGYAIEARIYAEDPDNNFLPTSGNIFNSFWPKIKNVRIDDGINRTDQVTVYYDPLIAKLIVYADNKNQALHKLNHALQHSHIAGITTNLSFLRSLVSDDVAKKNDPANLEIALNFAGLLYIHSLKSNSINNSPWKTKDSWRLNHAKTYNINLIIDNKLHKIDFKSLDIKKFKVNSHQLTIITNQQIYQAFGTIKNNLIYISYNNLDYNFKLADYRDFIKNSSNNQEHYGNLTSPMPGIITKILITKDQAIKVNQPLFIIEAMKMEHTIKAPNDGIITEVFCQPNDIVQANDVLLHFTGNSP